MNARQLVSEVSTYLVDQDPYAPYEHWSELDLLTYLRLAVELIASIQKDKFTRRVRHQLTAGTRQELPAACVEFKQVAAQLGAHGEPIAYPRRSSVADLHLRGSIGCRDCSVSTSSDYKLASWSFDETDPRVLYVEPAVPDGADVAIELSCFVPPTVDTLDSEIPLGLQLRPVIFELMLYYAYGVDTESVPSRDRSAVHWNNALGLLGVEQRAISNRYSTTRIPENRVGARK